VNRACEQALITRLRPYELRHSHASLLIEIGRTRRRSASNGHTEIGATTNVYGHLFEGKQRELTTEPVNDCVRLLDDRVALQHDDDASATADASTRPAAAIRPAFTIK
jgi:hypothetical protein